VIDYFKGREDVSPVLIAHSSMDQANDAMVRGGAHLELAKAKDVEFTESIRARFRSTEDLRKLFDYR